MRTWATLLMLFGLVACGSSSPPPEVVEEVVPKQAPRDESHRFPKDGLVTTSVVEDHVLGRDFLPAGNVAEYERAGKKFTVFLVGYESNEQAGLEAFDIKGQFADAKFVPHFGGFFGTEGGEPWFIFPKNKAVGGVVGLPLDEADQFARSFAGLME